jgi:Flp pilus assembly protein TadB
MSTQYSPRAARGSSYRRWAGSPASDLRVSDADRAEIADRLSKHYSDGRLDQDEFSERLDRAMSAKTQADLHGLLADLPGTGAPAKPQPRPHGRVGRIIFLALLIVIAAAVGQALLRSYLVILLIVLVAFLWLRYGPRHRH